MRIAIAGATGVVGRHVVDVARERGHAVVGLSRASGIDLLDPAAVDRALTGAEAVIDVSSIGTTSERFFGTATANLLAAGVAHGVAHHVTLSIVNVDRAPSGYYAGKVLQERLVAAGEVPWSILRATQFHEFAGQVLEQGHFGPIRAVPIMRTQPVAAREVAERLVDIAESDARGRAADLAGPREEDLVSLARLYARALHLRGPIIPIPFPGPMGAAMRSGALLPLPDATHAPTDFTTWLTTRQSTDR